MTSTTSQLRMTRVLLVEDNENDLDLTLSALGRMERGKSVDVVRDGAEALDYLYRQGAYRTRSADYPILVLLDLKMPRLDGLEVLRQVKSDPSLRHIPIVMLTSSREQRDVDASYRLGVNAFVVKPGNFKRFVEVLGSVGTFWTTVNEACSSQPAVRPPGA